MEKGGLNKASNLDKFSAADLKAMKETSQRISRRLHISRGRPAGNAVNPLRGEEQQGRQNTIYLLCNVKLLRVYEKRKGKKQ